MRWFFRRRRRKAVDPEIEVLKGRLEAADELINSIEGIRLNALDAITELRTFYAREHWHEAEANFFRARPLDAIAGAFERILAGVKNAPLDASRFTFADLGRLAQEFAELGKPMLRVINLRDELEAIVAEGRELRRHLPYIIDEAWTRRSLLTTDDAQRAIEKAVERATSALTAADVELAMRNPDHVKVGRLLMQTMQDLESTMELFGLHPLTTPQPPDFASSVSATLH